LFCSESVEPIELFKPSQHCIKNPLQNRRGLVSIKKILLVTVHISFEWSFFADTKIFRLIISQDV
jgi:hypothetical protein